MGVYQDFDQTGPETVPEDQGNDDCVNLNAAKSLALELARHFKANCSGFSKLSVLGKIYQVLASCLHYFAT